MPLFSDGYFSPYFEQSLNKRKKGVGSSWRMVETYIKVKGVWHYLYRAVDKKGQTIDFLLCKRRRRRSTQLFLIKAIRNNDKPTMINIDKSRANRSAICIQNKRRYKKKDRIVIRECKYLNNIVEQDHRFIKWRISRNLGFKEFESASRTISEIEIVRTLQKNKFLDKGKVSLDPFALW